MINEKLLLKTNIQKLFKNSPFIVEIFENYGLKCILCTFSEKVTLEEALKSSKLPSKEIIEEIVAYLECKSKT